jgi:hypothetical protein
VAGMAIATRGITDEAVTSLHGDVPRHMMNGVFVWDLLRAGSLWPPDEAAAYAREYFARYPALSIGHHAPLTAVLLVPFYAVFGVSVFAARLAMVACLLVAIAAMYSLARRLYDGLVAGWASLLLAVQPGLVPYGQHVMSEAPLIALALLTVDALLRFCASGRTAHYAVFVILAAASLYAKQTAIFLFPLYAGTLLLRLRGKRLLRGDVAGWTLAGIVLCLPLLAITLAFSPHNVAVVAQTAARSFNPFSADEPAAPSPQPEGAAPEPNVSSEGHAPGVDDGTQGDPDAIARPPEAPLRRPVLLSVLDNHLSLAGAVAIVIALLVSVAQRDGRVSFAAAWATMSIVGVLLFIGPYEPARYAILAVPAYCLWAASLAAAQHSRQVRWFGAALLVAVVAVDGLAAARVRPVGAGGYEAAARYVTSRSDSPTVLYSASADTGYFIFFVRKHDVTRQQVILRTDKLLTTSLVGRLDVETHITAPDEIYALLDRYGTRLVVVEDHESGIVALDWLRQQLHGPAFVERHRVPIESTDFRVTNVDLVTYEYLRAREPDPEAAIGIGLPIIGRELEVRLSDLLPAR